MAIQEIVQKGNEVLRQKAEKVLIRDISSARIQSTIRDMKDSLRSQDDGVAIAAPQIGVSLQIFVISGKVISLIRNEKDTVYDDIVCINPKIIKASKEVEKMEEGCLSVRHIYGHVDRHTKATIEAYDEQGKKFTRGGSGLMAQIFQHEIDHLNGVLFIDKAENIYNAE